MQILVLIRVLELISVPNELSVHWIISGPLECECNSLIWTYLYDADRFLQSRVLIRVLELIYVPNES